MQKKRPDWDEYFMSIAEMVATRSTCLRRKVGSVLALENRILATGYNGVPTGFPHCDEIGCIRQDQNIASGVDLHLCRGTHSEANLISQCARFGIKAFGATLYITTSPCSSCMKLLINAGIKKIIYKELYSDQLAVDLACQAGIEMKQMSK
jgi:dCMP deaminase